MSGRPPTPVGLIGKIKTSDITPEGAKVPVWVADCRVRDSDGSSRRVRVRGKSRSGAETALKKRLSQRYGFGASRDLTGASRLREAGELWLERQRDAVERGDLAPRSYEAYEGAWRLHVAPALGELRLREVTVGRCDAWQTALRRQLGASRTKKARSVLSAVLGLAARRDAIPTNPTRDLEPITTGSVREPRSMTAAEREAWLAWMDTHVADDPKPPTNPKTRRTRSPERTAEIAAARALGDITRLALATGARIGEVMAVGWNDVDFTAGTVHVRWHLVRVSGEGIVRMAGTKRGKGRLLAVPGWALDMLLRRRVANDLGYEPVFADQLGHWRDPNLVGRWIRWSRDEAGFGWVTSHVWRQTVLTELKHRGLDDLEIADQAGHAQISQTQAYMARGVASRAAAAALEDLL